MVKMIRPKMVKDIGFSTLQTDLRNAGVNWVDKEIVHFDNLITSRKPSDLDAFNEELIKTLS